jgi:hypothetical protein
MDWAEDEMVQGFMDGYDRNAPEPSANRSRSYRHGFANGRHDINHGPWRDINLVRQEAEAALAADRAHGSGGE